MFQIYGWMFITYHFKHYCPCRPIHYSTGGAVAAHQVAPIGNSVYFQGSTTVAIPDSCKTCGAMVSPSPVASPSCGCNSGFKVVQQTPMMQAPALRYNQYVDVPAQPMYGYGNQMAGMAGGNARPGGYMSSAYNSFFNRNN